MLSVAPAASTSCTNDQMAGQASTACVAYVWFRDSEPTGESNTEKKSCLPVPLVFSPQYPVTKISCGLTIAAFITNEGRVFTWKLPPFGDNKNVGSPKILAAIGGRRVVDVACGDHHLCCLCDNGEILTSGCYHYGQLGVHPSNEDLLENPDPCAPHCYCGRGLTASAFHSLNDVFLLTFTEPVTQVACGSKHSLVLTKNGFVWGMGQGVSGRELARDNIETLLQNIYYSPRMIQLTESEEDECTIEQIACGVSHSLALTNDGRVIGWGTNERGQIGNGILSKWEYPHIVNFPKKSLDIKKIDDLKLDNEQDDIITFIDSSCGSIAISNCGRVWIWGFNNWIKPHSFSDGTFTNQKWSIPSRQTVSLSTSELTRLSIDGMLGINNLTGMISSKTMLLKENSVGHFDVIGSSARITVGVSLHFQEIMLPPNSVHSPPSFGGIENLNPLKPSINSFPTLNLDGPIKNNASFSGSNSTIMTSTSCSGSWSPCSSSMTVNPTHQVIHESECAKCTLKDNTITSLTDKISDLESELSEFISQYQHDLGSISKNLEKEKQLKLQLEEDLQQLTNSPDDLKTWANELQQVLDSYQQSLNNTNMSSLIGIPVQRVAQKLLYFQTQLELEKKKYVLTETTNMEMMEQLKKTETRLNTTEMLLKNESEKKKEFKYLYEDLQLHVTELQEKNECLEEIINELKNKNETLLKKNEVFQHNDIELEEVRHELTKLQEMKDHANRERKLTLERCSLLENKNRRLEQSSIQVEEDISRTKISLEKAEQRASDLSFELRGIQREHELSKLEKERIQEELESFRRANTALEKHNERIRESLQQINSDIVTKEKEQNLNRQNLLQDLHHVEEHYATASKEIDVLKQKLNEVETSYTIESEKAMNFEALSKTLQEDIHTLKDEILCQKNSTDNQLKDLNERNISLIRQLNNRLTDEQVLTDKYHQHSLSSQDAIHEVQTQLIQAQQQYHTLIIYLRELGLIPLSNEHELLPTTDVLDNKDIMNNLNETPDSHVLENDPDKLAMIIEKEITQLRDESNSNAATVVTLMSHIHALESQVELYRTQINSGSAGVMKCECDLLKTKISALEAEVIEKQKLIEITRQLETVLSPKMSKNYSELNNCPLNTMDYDSYAVLSGLRSVPMNDSLPITHINSQFYPSRTISTNSDDILGIDESNELNNDEEKSKTTTFYNMNQKQFNITPNCSLKQSFIHRPNNKNNSQLVKQIKYSSPGTRYDKIRSYQQLPASRRKPKDISNPIEYPRHHGLIDQYNSTCR